ncbi:MAG: DUF3721 domain-containing protein [Vulcanococcus sp.]
MHNRLFSLLLIAPVAVIDLGQAVYAQANDMFPSKAAAEKRAKELKCSGAFAMGSDWMPCKDFATYEKAVKQEL